MRIKLDAKSEYEKKILEYLEENASDVLAAKINKGTKTMQDCWSFIVDSVKKSVHGSSCAVVEDKEVYGMAVHFFEEDGIKYEPIRAAGVKYEAKKPEEKKVQKTPEPKKKEQKPQKEYDLNGQMSFDDMFAGGVWA